MREPELFNKLKARLVPDLEFAKKQFSKWDCYTEKYNIFIELKCRYTHYDDLLIEKSKYDALMALDTGVRYICSTPVGVYSFNLKEIPEPEWITENMPNVTMFSNKHWVEKTVGYININMATNITYLIN